MNVPYIDDIDSQQQAMKREDMKNLSGCKREREMKGPWYGKLDFEYERHEAKRNVFANALKSHERKNTSPREEGRKR